MASAVEGKIAYRAGGGITWLRRMRSAYRTRVQFALTLLMWSVVEKLYVRVTSRAEISRTLAKPSTSTGGRLVLRQDFGPTNKISSDRRSGVVNNV